MTAGTCVARCGSGTPIKKATARPDSIMARPNADDPVVTPTSAPPRAGPAANATVLASSMRPLAAINASRGTSAGTSAGPATLNTTVPQAPIRPSPASSGKLNAWVAVSSRIASSETVRRPSAAAINVRRDMRSASTPAGMAKRSLVNLVNSPEPDRLINVANHVARVSISDTHACVSLMTNTACRLGGLRKTEGGRRAKT